MTPKELKWFRGFRKFLKSSESHTLEGTEYENTVGCIVCDGEFKTKGKGIASQTLWEFNINGEIVSLIRSTHNFFNYLGSEEMRFNEQGKHKVVIYYVLPTNELYDDLFKDFDYLTNEWNYPNTLFANSIINIKILGDNG